MRINWTMADLDINRYRAYLYINLDYVMMNFFKTFRVHHYTTLLVSNTHPLDVNYDNIKVNKKIAKLFKSCILDSTSRFWDSIELSSVGNFYWKRLKDYQNRIYFITNTFTDEELKYKQKWLSNRLGVEAENRLFNNVNIEQIARSELYPNLLVCNDRLICDKWIKFGGKAYWDLGKRSVSSYYVDEIKVQLDWYCGIDLIAGIPEFKMKRRMKTDNADIRSITVDDLYLI